MSAVTLTVVGAETTPHALVPTIAFRLRAEAAGPPIQSIQLRTQIRIEPERRRYSPDEHDRLLGLFGVPERWADTLQHFLWTHVTLPIGPFQGATEVELPVECSYDLEVATGQYLHSLADGEVPLVFLFSGTVFRRGAAGTTIEQIDWDRGEARFRLPVATWRHTMDTAFPGGGWLRLQRDTLDRLVAYRSAQALPTWDVTLQRLLDAAEVEV